MENNTKTPFYNTAIPNYGGKNSNFSFNYGEFALIKCLAGLKRYEIQHHSHTATKIIDHQPNY